MRMLRGLTLVWALAYFSHGAVYTVSKDGRGVFTTIQAAVNKAGKGDIVEILDAAVYPEQVTLDSTKHGLILRSANPGAAAKPVIRWKDIANVGPTTCQEALDPEKITFDQNGALRLIQVRNVLIQGIAVDGVVPTAIAYANIWGNGVSCAGNTHPLFLGNAGLLLNGSANAAVSDCDISGAYFGLYIKNMQMEGSGFTQRDGVDSPPFSRMALGNHIIEGSSIHDNSWGVFMEAAWGLGSTFRDNLIYRNHHRENQAAVVKAMPDGSQQPGGAFFFKAAMVSPMAIHNNTFAGNFLLIGGGYQAGAQHLVANNLFAAPNIRWGSDKEFSNSIQEMSSVFPRRMKHNVFAAQAETPVTRSQAVTAELFDSVAMQPVVAEKTVTLTTIVRIANGMPTPETATRVLDMSVPLSTGPVTVPVTLPPGIYPGALIAMAGHLLPEHGNRWQETGFLSEIAADADFLAPAPAFREVLRLGWPGLGYRTVSGADAGVGALPRAERSRNILRVVPLSPVRVEDGQVVLSFSAQLLGPTSPAGAALEIAYLRMEANVPVVPTSFGSSSALPLKEAEPLAIPSQAIRYGFNEIRIPLAGAVIDSNGNGFVEMAVRGAGVFSNVASFPILRMTSLFKVETLEESADNPLAKAEIGKAFRIRVSHMKTPAQTMPVALFLASGASLEILDSTKRNTAGLFTGPLPFTVKARFTQRPEGGTELICASSLLPIFGQSGPLTFEGADVSSSPAMPARAKAARPEPFLDLLGRKVGDGNGVARGVRVRKPSLPEAKPQE